jgi:hypothetical protein
LNSLIVACIIAMNLVNCDIDLFYILCWYLQAVELKK